VLYMVIHYVYIKKQNLALKWTVMSITHKTYLPSLQISAPKILCC
jgi:hypothetical protein